MKTPHAVVLLLAVSGCAVSPVSSPPSTISPPDVLAPASAAVATAPALDQWWRLYNDATLDTLVAEALANNRELRVAAANLAQANAALGQRRSARLPQTALTAGAGYGSTVNDQLAAALDQTEIRTGQRYDAGFDTSWELDLSGRIGHAIQAAEADAEANQAARDGVRVAVAAETTRAYVDSCAYAARAAVARQSLALLSRSHQLQTRLHEAGSATPLDVARAAALAQQASAAIAPLDAGRQNALYELAVLTGRPPDTLPTAASACDNLPQLDAAIPLGDVTALLQRRPDIREAERRLRASSARIGVASAELYPEVSIMGSVASSAPGIGNMNQKNAIAWSIGPVLSWRFPNSSAARARITAAQAGEAAALARFDATILAALKEVKQALASYQATLQQRQDLQAAARQSSEALRLAQLSRDAGAVSALELVDAERSAVEAAARLAAANADVASGQVLLFKALGGGWQAPPALQTASFTSDQYDD
ncbi:efflux transporter outer membrane subunit [Duganella sp. FT80W]|uniref:Efflux transporter outer membrane subunit n=1 Tax=Duganella guangzhouensis TaxID=2666084 RepID=A0A6I2KW18_9BURK|nr:TolC family protein [Duganella guangzhouensis]MRW90305.1 efflux transporter outer membrane subunit [Duganella guangzhouensis]